jgi:hypothetical protein
VAPKTALRLGIAGALLAAGAVLGAAGSSSHSFGVGVLRRDGVIVPFAAFDGKRWVQNWPLPDVEALVPVSVRDVPPKWWGPTPPLDRWQAWSTAEPQLLDVVQPDWVDVHCTRQIGLRTKYKAAEALPPSTVQPYPKDGLAIAPPQSIERIAVIAPESAEMRALIPAVHQAFNNAERESEKKYGHPVTQRAREGRAPDIEAVYAAGDQPRIYYVEATRRYRSLGRSADECDAIGFATGWFVRDGSGVRSLFTNVNILRCDRSGASYMLPLGVPRLAGKLYWLAQFSGWDHERYVVVEIKPKTVTAVLNVWGGSC